MEADSHLAAALASAGCPLELLRQIILQDSTGHHPLLSSGTVSRLSTNADRLCSFAREALWAETMTPAGGLNLVGMLAAFVIVLGAGLVDFAQVIGRIWNEEFETGLPSAFSFLWVFILLIVVCVAILATTEARSRRQDSLVRLLRERAQNRSLLDGRYETRGGIYSRIVAQAGRARA